MFVHPEPYFTVGFFMGCNAWNHAPDCDCGWGGDTGSGRLSGSEWSRYVSADGRAWSRDAVNAATYTVPNARCPICNASVFFYQSPFGGRVFFDELGPPWPKHPCTDNGPLGRPRESTSSSAPAPTHFKTGSILDGMVFAPVATHTPRSAYSHWNVSPYQWRPLICAEGKKPVPKGDYDWIELSTIERVPASGFFAPHGWYGDAPIYWRWSPDLLGMVELSTLSFPQGLDPAEIQHAIPGWITTEVELASWRAGGLQNPTPRRWNLMGFYFSFSWRSSPSDPLWLHLKPVDIALAKACFQRSADGGDWAGWNNLGVIHREGFGGNVDPDAAFACFTRAADSLEVRALENLLDCYRKGIGCEPDAAMIKVLEDLLKDHAARGG